jgi:hypothetical protein
MGELESIGSESGESEGRSAMWWTASEWARTGTGRLVFVGLMYSYMILINGFDLKKKWI